MSDLLNQIQESMKSAMKAKESEKVQLYRTLISSCKNKKIEVGHELNNKEVIQVLRKQAKQRKDSIEQFKKGNREDLVANEKFELDIIEKLLPAQMSAEDVEKIVVSVMEETGFKTMADRGKLMGAVMAKLKGKADGSVVNQVVSKLLS